MFHELSGNFLLVFQACTDNESTGYADYNTINSLELDYSNILSIEKKILI